ncbi:DinI-like family protein, partial [Salmonella enterica subsp. enterica]|nr:DNA damage-inducible protein I [Salmonella enterica subsp. enterica serovar Paratyphi C]ECI5205650.1 DNA damage-inducible protein I [Salmonella enterica subsp. enterica serovar Paratyphi C]ECR2689124.1 DinI-like family protein [Salmonella enterica subsp. enterica serovar Newport]EDT6989774.1 DinI-like family protein [Salmonella enterica subsp. enterica]
LQETWESADDWFYAY